jgi:hypothetical protein
VVSSLCKKKDEHLIYSKFQVKYFIEKRTPMFEHYNLQDGMKLEAELFEKKVALTLLELPS